MSQNQQSKESNWPEMAAALYEKITVRNADFTCDFDNLEVQLPGAAAVNPVPLKVNGSIRIRINGGK
jgi:hypothetical protein